MLWIPERNLLAIFTFDYTIELGNYLFNFLTYLAVMTVVSYYTSHVKGPIPTFWIHLQLLVPMIPQLFYSLYFSEKIARMTISFRKFRNPICAPAPLQLDPSRKPLCQHQRHLSSSIMLCAGPATAVVMCTGGS